MNLCEDHGLIILNGRTISDDRGNITFINKIGKSVIDICCVSTETKHFVKDFEIVHQIYSEHMPIVLKLKLLKEKCICNNVTSLLPRLKWLEGKRDVYCKELKEKLLCTEISEIDPEAAMSTLTQLIREVNRENQVTQAKNKEKNEWYDWSCAKARSRAFK